MSKVFIASRVGAKTKKQFEKNLKRYCAFARMAILQGYDAEATGPYYCMLLDDFSQKERELGLKLGRARAIQCHEFWALKNEDGSLSSGMQGDLQEIEWHNKKTYALEEPGYHTIEIKYFTPEQVENWLKENDPYGYNLWQKSK